MDREQLLSQWREEAARGMSGWDFSHIQGRCTVEPLPWDYPQVVREFLRPGVRLLVDLYHFDLEGESLSALVGYRGRLGHCHIASAQNSRLVPQPWDGQDYLPFFRALAAMGYEGRLSLEGDTRGGLPQIRSSLA